MIHIISCFWNCENYIEKCINSILKQSFKEFTVHMIDDMSYDFSLQLCRNRADSRFNIIKNNIKKFKLKNIDELISNTSIIKNDDIIVELDGDDCFAHDDVLSKVHDTYKKNPNLLICNGKFKLPNQKEGYSTKVKISELRYTKFFFSHLRTWKASLWRSVDKRYFLNTEKKYFKIDADIAYSLPMLEIAGQERYMHIDDFMVIYNDNNPYNDNKKDSAAGGRLEQLLKEIEIRLLDFNNNPYFNLEKIKKFVETDDRLRKIAFYRP